MNFPFLKGGGEMGILIRSFDWSKTSIGTPDKWPKSLSTIVGLMLRSKFPMFLWWGEEMIQFYNDAYRPSLGGNGKHPLSLGQKGKECWTEIWDIIYPLIQQVKQTGEATWREDHLVPIYRNGKIEDVYWTYSYSEVLDDFGKPAGIFVTCVETTEKIKNHSQLEESKEQLQFAIDAADLGTWDLNPATNKFKGNNRLKEWFGLPLSAEIELSLALNIIEEKDRQKVTDAIQWALNYASCGSYDIEYAIVNNNTEGKRIVRAKGRAYFNEQNIACRFNGILLDVTNQVHARHKIEEEVTQRTKELADANLQLQQQNVELNQFAYIASHDLQEPLRKVRTFTSLLESSLGELPPKAKDYMNRIQSATERMQALINDVLTFSRLSKETEKFGRVDLNKVLQDTLNDYDLLIDQKNAVVTADRLPVIEAIHLQMNQLFANIVSNALKFAGSEKQLQITICSKQLNKEEQIEYGITKENKVYHKIDFIDNGIGFDQSHAQQIFTIFQRLHGKTEYEGTGIGLAMCKKIVQNHRGVIYANSNINEGSAFTIILPEQQIAKP